MSCHSEIINSVCHRVIGKYNANFIDCHRIFNDQTSIRLNNKLNYRQFAIQNNVLVSPYVPEDLISSQFVYFIKPDQEKHSASLQRIKERFETDHFLILVERYPGYYDQFSIGWDSSTGKESNYYLNGFDDFWRVFYELRDKVQHHGYFKKGRVPLKKSMLSNIRGLSDVIDAEKLLTDPLHLEKIDMILESRFLRLPVILSRREKECIKSIFYGKTSKGAAQDLEISPRTVETYVDNVKSKLGCSKKEEVISYILKGICR